ncbi:MAG: c-type cytochrome [Leptolyngbyaceae cyanobacterium CRU_2_3]|nr:c-type cytochrome [Leptolyngbyaceae cyanobacterium CRU_2_3]
MERLLTIAFKLLLTGLMTVSLGVSVFVSAAAATDLTQGTKVFEVNCAGCHINGGNIVRRGKNLKLKTLQKNQMDSLEAIAAIVTHGKNNMSAYGDRLSPEQIQAVAAYVLDQAEQGW